LFGSKEYYTKRKKEIRIKNNLNKIIETIRGFSLKKINRGMSIEEYQKEYEEYIDRKKKRKIEKIKKFEIRKARKEKELEYNRYYRNTEHGKANFKRAKLKRSKKLKEAINTLTNKEWMDILKQYEFRCAYCNKKFNKLNRPTQDHVIPISKGGDNTKENVVPACRSCNSKKGAKMNYKKYIRKVFVSIIFL